MLRGSHFNWLKECCNYERPDGTIQYQQVVVPRSLRGEFLQATHSGLINGHFGVEKSRERLRQLAYWSGWAEDVRLFVARCNLCNQYRHGPRGKRGQLQQALACAPMNKVHIDLTGPHVQSSNGFKYILTVICAFTKYLIAVPLRDKTSKLVARALVKHVYLVHGPPEILVHDGGGEFWSQVMQELADLLEIQVSKITSHRPQANGMVERVHATMHAVFAKIVNSNQKNWCQLVDHVVHAYNTATHSSSSFSPYYLMHMRHPRVPLELLIEKPTAAAAQSTDEYVQQTAERMRQAYTVVREALKANFERSKKRYDARVKTAQFKVGDFVYYYVPRKHVGKNRKWALDNRGPFRVQRKLNDVNYAIQKSPTSNPIIVHIDRLTRYHISGDGEQQSAIPASWRTSVDTSSTGGRQPATSSDTLIKGSAINKPSMCDQRSLGSGAQTLSIDSQTSEPTTGEPSNSPKNRVSDDLSSMPGDTLSNVPDLPLRPKRNLKRPAKYQDYVRVVRLGSSNIKGGPNSTTVHHTDRNSSSGTGVNVNKRLSPTLSCDNRDATEFSALCVSGNSVMETGSRCIHGDNSSCVDHSVRRQSQCHRRAITSCRFNGASSSHQPYSCIEVAHSCNNSLSRGTVESVTVTGVNRTNHVDSKPLDHRGRPSMTIDEVPDKRNDRRGALHGCVSVRPGAGSVHSVTDRSTGPFGPSVNVGPSVPSVSPSTTSYQSMRQSIAGAQPASLSNIDSCADRTVDHQ